MFADWELIGIPQRLVLSERGLKDGVVELQGRRESAATRVGLARAVQTLVERLQPAQ
jgi:prolyl-tRNA synthetase